MRPTEPTSAVAVSTPMPGISRRRWTVALSFAIAPSCRSMALMHASNARASSYTLVTASASGSDRAGAYRVDQGVHVRAVRLVPAQEGLHMPHGKQGHGMPMALRHAPPIIRGSTRLHHHVTRRLVLQEAPTLFPIESSALDEPPLAIRDSEFKHRQ